MAMAFVGQCEALVCLGFVGVVPPLWFFPWPQSSQVREWGVNSFRMSIFPVTYPFQGMVVVFGDGFCRTV